MKTTILLILLLSLSLANCQSQPEPVKKNYELVVEEGLIIEKFDSTVVNVNKYNHNNVVYKVGTRFRYTYEHRTAENELKYFKINADRNSWSFVTPENTDSTKIKSFVMKVADGNPMSHHDPDYNQTVVTYQLKEGYGLHKTGIIENEANTWIHPIRAKFFIILELNPFPYIKAPFEIGNKWTWDLLIGSQWGDERWKTWEGNIDNKYTYEITGQETLKTALGDIECFIIESEATSRIGETSLTAYFNEKYGFVKLAYTNIDGSKTNLELIEYSEGKSEE